MMGAPARNRGTPPTDRSLRAVDIIGNPAGDIEARSTLSRLHHPAQRWVVAQISSDADRGDRSTISPLAHNPIRPYRHETSLSVPRTDTPTDTR
jgi:hypothetical protein